MFYKRVTPSSQYSAQCDDLKGYLQDTCQFALEELQNEQVLFRDIVTPFIKPSRKGEFGDYEKILARIEKKHKAKTSVISPNGDDKYNNQSIKEK